MNDIAIICKDVRLSRMLELELGSSGYSPVCNPRGGSYRLWIVDLDTVTLSASHPERVYLGIAREPDALADDQRQGCLKIFRRPFAIETFCREISTLLSPDQSAVSPLPSAAPRLQRTPLGYELDGEPISLTVTEERILTALCERRGQTVSRAELCALLENDTNEKLADVYICLLRRKLESGGAPRLIFTVRGIGYRLENEKQV